MAKYKGPKAKIARRFNAPMLGYEKILKRKPYPPGQHGQKPRRKSDYALQLDEKQKAKYIYDLLERQFRTLVYKASSQKGDASDTLLQMLEMRIAHVVFRLGISPTNRAARQLVVHRHVHLNGRTFDRPAHILQIGDRITLSEKAKQFTAIQDSLASNKNKYPWLVWDPNTMTGKIVALPIAKDIPVTINSKKIIEFYAR